MALGKLSFAPGSSEGSVSSSKALEAAQAAQATADEAAGLAKKASDTVATYDKRLEQMETMVSTNTSTVSDLSKTVGEMVDNVTAAAKKADSATTAAEQATNAVTAMQESVTTAINAAKTAEETATAVKGMVESGELTGGGSSGEVPIVDATPTTLKHGTMVMCGNTIYVGAQDESILVLLLSSLSSETITLTDGEIAYVNGVVYRGDNKAGLQVIFTNPFETITVSPIDPTTTASNSPGQVFTYKNKLYVGDSNGKFVLVTGAITPVSKPLTGEAGHFYIWGGYIYYYLSNGSWIRVGTATGIGSGEANDSLDGWEAGRSFYFNNREWTVFHVTDDWLYIILTTPTEETVFGESTTYADSELVKLSAAMVENFSDDDKKLAATTTVGSVSALVNALSIERLQGYDYLKKEYARTAANTDGDLVRWWLGSPNTTDDKIQAIDTDGKLIELDPSEKAYFRPFVAIHNT